MLSRSLTLSTQLIVWPPALTSQSVERNRKRSGRPSRMRTKNSTVEGLSSSSREMLLLLVVRLQPHEENPFADATAYPIQPLAVDCACASDGTTCTVPFVTRGGAASIGMARKRSASIFVFMVG